LQQKSKGTYQSLVPTALRISNCTADNGLLCPVKSHTLHK